MLFYSNYTLNAVEREQSANFELLSDAIYKSEHDALQIPKITKER